MSTTSASPSPAKRVSSRTPKLSAKMIALEEEVNMRRRKTHDVAKASPSTTAAPTSQVAASSPAAVTNSPSAAVTPSPAPPSKSKVKAASWESPSQPSTQRSRKRKSSSTKTTPNSSNVRKNKNIDTMDISTPPAEVAPQTAKDTPSTQSKQQLNMNRTPTTPTAAGRSAASSKHSSTPQTDRSAPASTCAAGGMYEEGELYLSQFTPDGGTGCNSSQQLLVVDDTSESTVSMMSFGVTSNSPGLPSTSISRLVGGRETKKKKAGTGGKKVSQENNASEDEAEEKWLMAIEAGKLEEDAELRSMKDPALMTARQRAVVEAKQARVEHLQHIQALHEAWKDQAAAEQLSSEVLEKRAQKAAKRRRLAEEKRDKEKKDTIKRLLKKADSRQKTKKLQRIKAQMAAKVSYRYTYEGMTVSFPKEPTLASLGIDLTPKKANYPTPVLCSNVGCANLKKYQCSSNGLPVCSLQCYRQVSLLPPLAQLLESAAGTQDTTEEDAIKAVEVESTAPEPAAATPVDPVPVV